jgi:antitoxin VapB
LTRSSPFVYIIEVPIYITNSEAEDLARELAAATGETLTDVVIQALRDRRDRLRRPTREERLARLREISDRTGAIVAGRRVNMDDMYDEFGLPK